MPKNCNYFWSFGALATIVLIVMIVSGSFLAMNYTPHTEMAFDSVERIMRDVNYGWLIRYINSNRAAFFFIIVYHFYLYNLPCLKISTDLNPRG